MTEKQPLCFFIYTHTHRGVNEWSIRNVKILKSLKSKTKVIASDLTEDVTAGYASLNNNSNTTYKQSLLRACNRNK